MDRHSSMSVVGLRMLLLATAIVILAALRVISITSLMIEGHEAVTSS